MQQHQIAGLEPDRQVAPERLRGFRVRQKHGFHRDRSHCSAAASMDTTSGRRSVASMLR